MSRFYWEIKQSIESTPEIKFLDRRLEQIKRMMDNVSAGKEICQECLQSTKSFRQRLKNIAHAPNIYRDTFKVIPEEEIEFAKGDILIYDPPKEYAATRHIVKLVDMGSDGNLRCGFLGDCLVTICHVRSRRYPLFCPPSWLRKPTKREMFIYYIFGLTSLDPIRKDDEHAE